MMKRKFKKILCVFLSAIIVLQILPLTVFAEGVNNTEALDVSIPETEMADIEYELEEERDEFSKTYLLEDGTYVKYISSTALHTKNQEGTWKDITKLDSPGTISELQAEINENSVSLLSSISDSNTVTADYSDMEYQTIGTNISGINEDELRIQQYDLGVTSQAYSLGYVKLTNLKLPDLGDSCIVTKAVLGAYCSKLSGSQNNIVTAQLVTDAWPNNNTNSHPVADEVMDYNAIDSSDEKYYEWDITEAACQWSNEAIANNGVALVPHENNCKISAYVDSIVLYYSIVEELDNDFSFHSVDMGRAGTAYINDYTNDFYLVRDELSIDGNIMPVSITRTYNNANNTDLTTAGSGWHWNYVSTLTRVRQSSIYLYKWVKEDGSIVYFESTADGWKEQGVDDGYNLTIASDFNTIQSENDSYKYQYGASSHRLENIVDENEKTIHFTYDDSYGLSEITDGVGRKFTFDDASFSGNSYINKLSAFNQNGEAITLDESTIYLGYSYGYENTDGNRSLSAVSYRDLKEVNYSYDENDNLISVENVDGTELCIEYDENGRVTSYTKYASNGTTILDSLSIDATEAYQRIFTDKDGNITRQQYNTKLDIISEITGDEGYFNDYDENGELQSLSVTEEHTNLIQNSDFSNSLNNWTVPNNRGVSVVTDTDSGFKSSLLDNKVISIPGNYKSINYAKQIYIFNDDEVHTNEIYTVGVWAKVNGSISRTDEYNDNKSRTIGVLVNAYVNDESGGENTDQSLAQITYDNSISDWQYMMVSFVIPNNTDGIQIALTYNYQIGTALFDGITLYKSTNSFVVYSDSTAGGCICETCTEPDCPCDCTDESTCDHIFCKRGTTTVENSLGLTTSETTTDAVTSMQNTYAYSGTNNYLAQATDKNGVITYYNYDENTGKLSSLASGSSDNAINYTYNAVGLLKTISQTVTNIMTDNDVTMTSEYTYNGDTLTSISHNGFIYSYEYDVYGNTTSVKINNDTLADYTYINNGESVGSITYGNGDALIYTYDSNGNILSVSSATVNEDGGYDNQVLKYSYTYSDGELVSYIDNTNNTITNYEDNGYSVYSASTNDEVLIYTYSGTESSDSYTYSIDDATNISISSIINEDDYNHNTGKTTTSGSTIITKTVTENNEDTASSSTYSNSSVMDYYGRTLSTSFGTADNQIHTQYTYKSNGNYTTTQIASAAYAIGNENYVYSYTYDNAGRLASKSLNNELLVSYEYDEAGQLVRENNNEIGETYLFTYNEGGNKIASYYCPFTEDNIDTSDCTVYDLFEYSNDWSDQVSKYNNSNITYDELGNMVSSGGYIMYYWEGRQLTKSRISSTRYSHYTYNQDGLRTENKVTNSAGTTTYADYRYTWNNSSQLASQNLTVNSQMTFSDSYGHRTTLNTGNYITVIIYNESGEAVGFAVDDGTNLTVYYYLKDITGQINAVVNTETNQIAYSCTYDSWGYILDEYCINALAAYGNPLRYKDYMYDNDTELYYLQSRYYDAELSRFISADDPALTDTNSATSFSTNMYIYCENDSINNIDSIGYFSVPNWIIANAIDIIITIAIPGASALLAPVKATFKSYAKKYVAKKFKVYIGDYIEDVVLPKLLLKQTSNIKYAVNLCIEKVVKHFNSSLKSRIKNALVKCTQSLLSFSNTKMGQKIHNFLNVFISSAKTVSSLLDIISSYGSFFAFCLDVILDGTYNKSVKLW